MNAPPRADLGLSRPNPAPDAAGAFFGDPANDREYLNPAYRGLYAADRPVTLGPGNAANPPKGTLADLETIYPEELARVLGQRATLIDEIGEIRRKRRKPKTRDRNRLASMEAELETINKRLSVHDRRARGAHMELAKLKGPGWVNYLQSLFALLYFLEKCQNQIRGLLSVLRDPGRSSRAILKNLAASLRREIAETVRLSLDVAPPENLLGARVFSAVPVFETAPPPFPVKKLLSEADAIVKELKRARLVCLDELLRAERRLKESAPPALSLPPAASARPLARPDDARGAPSVFDSTSLPVPAPRESPDGAPPEDTGATAAPSSALDSSEDPLAAPGQSKELPPPSLDWAPSPAVAPLPPGEPSEADEGYFSPRRSPLRTLAFFTAGLALALLLVYLKVFFFPGAADARLVIFNGLGTRVKVTVNEMTVDLGSGQGVERALPRGVEANIRAFNAKGRLIEEMSVTPPLENELTIVYSVAGAAVFLEWEARYGETLTESREKVIGVPRLFTSAADFILSSPPPTLKIKGEAEVKISLNPLFGAHPDLSLSLLSPSDRLELAATHGRWDAPSDLYLPLWLRALVDYNPERAQTILEERLADFPEDPWAIRELLSLSSPAKVNALCNYIEEKAAQASPTANQEYLAARCVAEEVPRRARYLSLLETYPEHPLLNRSVGFAFYAQGELAQAHHHLWKAFTLDPRSMLTDLELLARLAHYMGAFKSSLVTEIGPWSPSVRKLLTMSGPPDSSEREGTAETAFRYLDEGLVNEALAAAGEKFRPALLPFAAASDGASDALFQEVLAADLESVLNFNSSWTLLGLYLRASLPTGEIEEFIVENSSNPEFSAKILGLVKSRALPELEKEILGLSPRALGEIALAVFLTSPNAETPESFRARAKGLLFMGERPFLR
ncbi:MAG: hypothetical protein LBO66_08070 [Deltaproteobacteria bacterium]|jgi:hypothetical protein|nr:hypothetical protein [Deltaproteobacteria bacterium]